MGKMHNEQQEAAFEALIKQITQIGQSHALRTTQMEAPLMMALANLIATRHAMAAQKTASELEEAIMLDSAKFYAVCKAVITKAEPVMRQSVQDRATAAMEEKINEIFGIKS